MLMRASQPLFAWKVKTQTTPAPLHADRSRWTQALISYHAWPSSLCTQRHGLPVTAQNILRRPIHQRQLRRVVLHLQRPEAMSLAPVITMGTWNVVPAATEDPTMAPARTAPRPAGSWSQAASSIGVAGGGRLAWTHAIAPALPEPQLARSVRH